MTLVDFNQLATAEALAALSGCCAAESWQQLVVDGRPYANLTALLSNSDLQWQKMAVSDYLEAFSAHPQIGNVSTLRQKYAATKALAAGEQGAVKQATEQTLKALADGNSAYLAKFGFIFIVCATGKSADEMLALLNARLPNNQDQELTNAAEEQRKITNIRLIKLLS